MDLNRLFIEATLTRWPMWGPAQGSRGPGGRPEGSRLAPVPAAPQLDSEWTLAHAAQAQKRAWTCFVSVHVGIFSKENENLESHILGLVCVDQSPCAVRLEERPLVGLARPTARGAASAGPRREVLGKATAAGWLSQVRLSRRTSGRGLLLWDETALFPVRGQGGAVLTGSLRTCCRRGRRRVSTCCVGS